MRPLQTHMGMYELSHPCWTKKRLSVSTPNCMCNVPVNSTLGWRLIGIQSSSVPSARVYQSNAHTYSVGFVTHVCIRISSYYYFVRSVTSIPDDGCTSIYDTLFRYLADILLVYSDRYLPALLLFLLYSWYKQDYYPTTLCCQRYKTIPLLISCISACIRCVCVSIY